MTGDDRRSLAGNRARRSLDPVSTPEDSSPDPAIPAGSGTARELSQVRKKRPKAAETGRMHHMGAAPAVMPVWLPDGTITTTRTSPSQLADRTVLQLGRLKDRLTREMTAAATAMDYEQAARLRDEVAAVDTELKRRENP
jgi:hypothetical protein